VAQEVEVEVDEGAIFMLWNHVQRYLAFNYKGSVYVPTITSKIRLCIPRYNEPVICNLSKTDPPRYDKTLDLHERHSRHFHLASDIPYTSPL
jgi:hypothetical protein